MEQMPTDLVTGNFFDKYRSTNRIHRLLVNGFVTAARKLLRQAAPSSILEAGSGPGDLAARLVESCCGPGATYLGTDICEHQIKIAQERYPNLKFRRASIYDLPVSDKSFDLCMACEVLEHIERPDLAVAELARVAQTHVLISVPWEPVWRALNCARGKYLLSLGNTPGHIQHFSRRSIRNLVAKHFEIIDERRPFPWTFLLAKHKNV